MDQPFRMKNNGQISIVLNSQKRKALTKEPPEVQAVSKAIPPEHAILKEIEEALNSLVGM